MPNRIIKESICVSDDINGLSWFAEVFFYRLIVNCDDFGRFDGRMNVIRNRLFPLKNISARTVQAGFQELLRAGLVETYEVEGKPYILLATWKKHQIMRAKRAKYPEPHLHADGMQTLADCKHVHADCKHVHADCKQMLSIYESESESNPNPNPIRESEPDKLVLGEYENVVLSQTELERLQRDFPQWDSLIQRLSAYMASSGKSYKNHYVTLREWAKRDIAKTKPPVSQWAIDTVKRMMEGGDADA